MSEATPVLHERYTLGVLLGGRDGSATYLADDVQTGERCVVKTLSVGEVVRGGGQAYSFDPDDFTKVIELFEREARVLAHLEHPGIPRFIDHFTESVEGDTRLYTVQEYVEGKTLQALVEEGKHFTEAEAREVCRQIAEILHHLHGRSPPLIHRDIKPTNIILDEAGTVHLVDFGSVRNAIGGDRLDGKTIVGTYGYMPIEQYEARAVPQSDFYALGMTLVYILSHQEPTQIPRRGVALDFRPHVNVSESFAAVLERLIEAAPEDRHPSAEALLDHLESRETGVALVGPPAGRRLAWAVAALFVAFGGLGSLFLRAAPEAAPPPRGIIERGVVPLPPPEPRLPLMPSDGVFLIDIDRDFRYTPSGWPMGRSVGQTGLPGLTREPLEDLHVPASLGGRDADVYYGYFPMGNGSDQVIAFALADDASGWALHVDSNNNEDLTDDGPPHFNDGTGTVLATEVSIDVEVVGGSGDARVRPYNLWVWLDDDGSGRPGRGRFYARNHYAGVLVADGREYQASVFERSDHDGLYRESGICIDLDADGDCQEDMELFYDGDVVAFEGGALRLTLVHP